MKNIWLIIGIVVVVLVLLGLGFAGSGMMGYGYGRGMMFPLFCLAGPLFWALVIAGIVWLVVTQLQKSGGMPGAAPRESALDILKSRYAKGEITKEQFDEMKKAIE